MCIPFKNSYIHRRYSLSGSSYALCIPFKNSYIHLIVAPKPSSLDCVSLSKTVIFIQLSIFLVYSCIVYPFQKQLYSSLKETNLERATIVYPFQKQLYSSSFTLIDSYCLIVYPFQKQLYSSLYLVLMLLF